MSSPAQVEEHEQISRYINEKKKIRPKEGKAGYNAFMPPRTLRMSVYRTDGLDEAGVWRIADEFVATAEKPVIARADLEAREYLSQQLSFDPDGIPHPRHANVIGWSDEQSFQKVIALQLAEAAVLVRKSATS